MIRRIAHHLLGFEPSASTARTRATGPSPERDSSRSGFTLVEVVLATAMLAMGMGATTLTISMAIRMASANSNLMGAMHAGRQELEELTARGFHDPSIEVGTHYVTNGIFTASYQVTSAGPGRKTLRMDVPYLNPMTGQAASVRLETLLAESLQW